MVALTDTKRRLVRQNIPPWAVYPPIKAEDKDATNRESNREMPTYVGVEQVEDFDKKLLQFWYGDGS